MNLYKVYYAHKVNHDIHEECHVVARTMAEAVATFDKANPEYEIETIRFESPSSPVLVAEDCILALARPLLDVTI